MGLIIKKRAFVLDDGGDTDWSQEADLVESSIFLFLIQPI